MRKFKVKIDSEEYIVEVEEVKGAESTELDSSAQQARAQVASTEPKPESKPKSKPKSEPKTEVKAPATKVEGGGEVKAPLAGVVMELLVSEGEEVHSDQAVLILEAMKMENEIQANSSGTIESIKVKEGDSVNTGQVMIVIA